MNQATRTLLTVEKYIGQDCEKFITAAFAAAPMVTHLVYKLTKYCNKYNIKQVDKNMLNFLGLVDFIHSLDTQNTDLLNRYFEQPEQNTDRAAAYNSINRLANDTGITDDVIELMQGLPDLESYLMSLYVTYDKLIITNKQTSNQKSLRPVITLQASLIAMTQISISKRLHMPLGLDIMDQYKKLYTDYSRLSPAGFIKRLDKLENPVFFTDYVTGKLIEHVDRFTPVDNFTINALQKIRYTVCTYLGRKLSEKAQ